MRVVISKIIVMLFYICRIFPIKNNKIVISNFLGQGYKEEGAIVLEGLLDIDENLDIVWLANNTKSFFPAGIRVVKNISLKAIYELATAKVWIDNSRKRYYIRKRKGQYYIQLWHSEVCIKHIEKDAEKQLTPLYVQGAKNDSKMIDLMVATSEWRYKNMQESFWYDGEYLKGSLYLDKNTDEEKEEIKAKVRQELGIKRGTKVILYAPTFRNDHNLEVYNLDYEKVLATCQQRFGGDWNIIVRLHPELTTLQNNIEYTDTIKNGSNYPKFYDLLLATDILISDYSGVIFNGLKDGQIVLIYASDYEKYTTSERGMYFNYHELPVGFAESNEELIDVINHFDVDEYHVKRQAFVDELGFYSNDAVPLIRDIVLNKVKE